LDYQWIAGSPKNALQNPHEVVLAESRARAYFLGADVRKCIGQTIVYDDSVQCTVTGIVKDLDQITDFTFKEFVSFPTFQRSLNDRHSYLHWGSISSASQFLIKLKKGVDPNTVEKQIQEVRKKYAKDEYLQTKNYLQPLSDIHFNRDYDNFDQRLGNKNTLRGLIFVAVFLLLLGCINFINLSTAQSGRRAREIGIRKTMGSSIQQLILQFIGETFILTIMATGISLILMPVIFKIFSGFIPNELNIGTINVLNLAGFILLLMVIVSLLAGIYPAFILSKYNPVLVLKNVSFHQSGKLGRKAMLRKVLSISQFAIAQFFIMATLIVAKQIHYSVNLDMGFDREAIVNFTTPFDYYHQDKKATILLEKLKQIPGIKKISLAGDAPAGSGFNFTTMKFNKDGKEIETSVEIKDADTSYLSLFNMKLLAGRNLRQTDTAEEYLVNETYARFLGFTNPSDIVGKYLDRGSNKKVPIVGLVADFHSGSTQRIIKPMALMCEGRFHSDFHLLLGPKGENTSGWKKTLTEVERQFKEIYPNQDFSYEFFDDAIAKFYNEEQNLSSLLNWCMGLSVFISCLGLLGLVIYTTTQRTREIGVRKVLGATVSQIVSLLSKDFLLLVMIAFVLAAPLTWWAMHNWLNNYAYRTEISWWIFGSTVLLMLITAFATLSIQTIRTAIENPVKSLRTE
jgi:ABC-type antimicrobial peptide transport system permease subunit